MQRVEGPDAPGEVEPGEQGANGRDLVALALDRFLALHERNTAYKRVTSKLDPGPRPCRVGYPN